MWPFSNQPQNQLYKVLTNAACTFFLRNELKASSFQPMSPMSPILLRWTEVLPPTLGALSKEALTKCDWLRIGRACAVQETPPMSSTPIAVLRWLNCATSSCFGRRGFLLSRKRLSAKAFHSKAAVYWQTYDAFARVSMSVGINQLMLGMSYYILGPQPWLPTSFMAPSSKATRSLQNTLIHITLEHTHTHILPHFRTRSGSSPRKTSTYHSYKLPQHL